MNFTLAITGPSGAGKSTVAQKLAKQIPNTVNIDADVVKHMIANGFVYDMSDEGVKQWELLGKNIGELANNFHEEGYNVIINGYINEPAWENIHKIVDITNKVLLFPKILALEERDAMRDNEFQMGKEAINEHIGYFSNSKYYDEFTKLETDKMTVDETVTKLKSIVA